MTSHALCARFALLGALATGVLPIGASATLVYDGFDYSAGQDLSGLDGGSGWSNPWNNNGGARTFTLGPGLEFGTLAVAPGAATTEIVPVPPNLPGSQVTTYPRTFATPTGNEGSTFYLSFLLRPEDDFGFYGGLNLGNGLFIGKSGTTDTYGLESSTIASSSLQAVANTTVLLVLRAQIRAGDDLFELYVNPALDGAVPRIADATLITGVADPTAGLYINNAGGWTIDEIRLGATFEDVTPSAVPLLPAAPFMLGALGSLGIVRARRGRPA